MAEPILGDFGGSTVFSGSIATVRVFEDNVLVRSALEQPGGGRILVIDGRGSLRCALVGDQIVGLAQKNGWSGLVVHGCIRDSDAIAQIRIGVKALATNPRKSQKRGEGERDVPVTFAGITFEPGDVLFADADGVVVLDEASVGT